VGEVRDMGLNREPPSTMISPLAQLPDGMTKLNSKFAAFTWIVKTRQEPHQMTALLSEQLRQASGGLPVARVRSMEEVVARSTARQDFNMLLLTIFGGSALVLAAIGIYGLMAYSVQQRTQEIGFRMAMGADRSRITCGDLAGDAAGAGRGGDWNRSKLRPDAPDRQSAIRRQALGSSGVLERAGDFELGGTAGGLAAGDAGVQAKSDGGATSRVGVRAASCGWRTSARCRCG